MTYLSAFDKFYEQTCRNRERILTFHTIPMVASYLVGSK